MQVEPDDLVVASWRPPLYSILKECFQDFLAFQDGGWINHTDDTNRKKYVGIKGPLSPNEKETTTTTLILTGHGCDDEGKSRKREKKIRLIFEGDLKEWLKEKRKREREKKIHLHWLEVVGRRALRRGEAISNHSDHSPSATTAPINTAVFCIFINVRVKERSKPD